MNHQISTLILAAALTFGLTSCEIPNGCESIQANTLSDCFAHGCDGVAAVNDDRVFYQCRDQSVELQAAILAGQGAEYEGAPCVQADSAALLEAVGADRLLGAFTYSHVSVEDPYWGVSTLHARAMLSDDSELVTGTATAYFVCCDGVWNVLNSESALSLQTDRGKVAIAPTCGSACDMCIADGYRCGAGCNEGYVSDSLRMVQCTGRIPYENEYVRGQ